MNRRTAIVAITRRGREQALCLHAGLPDATLYLLHGALGPEDGTSAALPPDGPSPAVLYQGRLGALIEEIFPRARALVLFCAVGIAVRVLAPHLVSKRQDPAVVVVDEQARHVISLLAGHLGGANELTERVADILGARPVITTASDLSGTIAVDLLGAERGWHMERLDQLTALSAALVNGLPVGIYQDAGERDWWPAESALPTNVSLCADVRELGEGRYAGALVISDRLLPETTVLPTCSVIYRPRTLVLGIGCNRGTPADEIADLVDSTLREHRLAAGSVGLVATIDLKRDETGLTEYAARIGAPVSYLTAAQLAAVRDLPNPSATVNDHVGAPGVCEPAALLAAGAARLVVPKVKRGNVTLAVARIED